MIENNALVVSNGGGQRLRRGLCARRGCPGGASGPTCGDRGEVIGDEVLVIVNGKLTQLWKITFV